MKTAREKRAKRVEDLAGRIWDELFNKPFGRERWNQLLKILKRAQRTPQK